MKSLQWRFNKWGIYAGPNYVESQGWVLSIMWDWHPVDQGGWFLRCVAIRLQRPARVRWQAPVRLSIR